MPNTATIVIVALVIVFVLYEREQAAASALGTPPPKSYADGSPQATGGFADLGPGAPGLGPIYTLVKPLQPVISGALTKVNSAIGGTDVYGKPSTPVKNASGEFTSQQGGATITYHKDGTITRRANGLRTADVLKGIGRGVSSGVKAGTQAVGHGVSKVLGWL